MLANGFENATAQTHRSHQSLENLMYGCRVIVRQIALNEQRPSRSHYDEQS